MKYTIIVLFSKHSYDNKGSFKYFIGYLNNSNGFPILWCMKLPQMNGYTKYFGNRNKDMNLLVHDEKLLRKYSGKLIIYQKKVW